MVRLSQGTDDRVEAVRHQLKSVEAEVRKALKDAETSDKPEAASGVATGTATAQEG